MMFTSSEDQSVVDVCQAAPSCSTTDLPCVVDTAVQRMLPVIRELLDQLESRLLQEMQELRPCLPWLAAQQYSYSKGKSQAEGEAIKKSSSLLSVSQPAVQVLRTQRSGRCSPEKRLALPSRSSPKHCSLQEASTILPNEVNECSRKAGAHLSKSETGLSHFSKMTSHQSLEQLMKRVDDVHIKETRHEIAKRTKDTSESDGQSSWALPVQRTLSNLTPSEPTIIRHPSGDVFISEEKGHVSYFQTLVECVSCDASSNLVSPSSRPNLQRGMTIHNLREGRQDELVAMALDSRDTHLSEVVAPIWLYFAGVLPLRICTGDSLASRLLRNVGRIVNLCAITCIVIYYSSKLTDADSEDSCNEAICMKDVLSPLLAMAVGCSLRLLSCCFSDDQVVGSATVTKHVNSIGVSKLWIFRSRIDMLKVSCCWACILGAATYVSLGWKLTDMEVITFVFIWAFVSQIFMAMALSMVHTCRGLALSIDDFCRQITEEQSCDNAVENWNILQAILRRVCTTVSRSFTILLTSSLVATFLPAILASNLMAMLPGAFTLFALLWVSLFIGGVTSKCDRVPSFINMLHFGENFDNRRQYVVNYITNSRAGFYMFDVRVTGELVAKCAYVFCVLAAAFVTRMLSSKGID